MTDLSETPIARRVSARRAWRVEHALRGPSCVLDLGRPGDARRADVRCSRCARPVGSDPITPTNPTDTASRRVHLGECP